MRTRAACCVLLAPNIELGRDDGGRLGSLLQPLLAQAREIAIPVVYALSRVTLGQVHCQQLPRHVMPSGCVPMEPFSPFTPPFLPGNAKGVCGGHGVHYRERRVWNGARAQGLMVLGGTRP